MPNTIWIWEISTLSLFSVANHIKGIKDFSWSPTHHILAISTENDKIYILSLDSASICDIDVDSKTILGINKINWNVDGRSFLISDKVKSTTYF